MLRYPSPDLYPGAYIYPGLVPDDGDGDSGGGGGFALFESGHDFQTYDSTMTFEVST